MSEEEFYNSIEVWISSDVKTWNHITLLAYFCHKYEKKNGVKFRLVRSKKGPISSKESRDIAKLFETLAPENYKDLPTEKKSVIRQEINYKILNYINWMFDYKFKNSDNSINGTHWFLMPSMINEFERMYSKHLKKRGEQDKFVTLLDWCAKNMNDIFESHQLEKSSDLRMIKRYADLHSLSDDTPEVKLINKAVSMGLLDE
jgi:hypothetical protein